MIEHNDIHVGNWIQVDVGGTKETRQVVQTSVERIGTKKGEKSGWFYPQEVYPILLTEEWLDHFEFKKEDSGDDNTLRYRKGTTTYTLTYLDKNDKNRIVLDCHGTHMREIENGLYVHTLQNHFEEMTKVPLV